MVEEDLSGASWLGEVEETHVSKKDDGTFIVLLV